MYLKEFVNYVTITYRFLNFTRFGGPSELVKGEPGKVQVYIYDGFGYVARLCTFRCDSHIRLDSTLGRKTAPGNGYFDK